MLKTSPGTVKVEFSVLSIVDSGSELHKVAELGMKLSEKMGSVFETDNEADD